METYPISIHKRIICFWFGLIWILVAGTGSAVFSQEISQDGMEVLTRGPIHEAFASVAANAGEPGPLVPRLPPDPIEELPPDQRPEGDNVEWIPGYWSWDEERTDFIWISGVWRAIPPGRQWVPGYWSLVDNQIRYVSGFWAPTEMQETVYLPPPPASREVGPNSPSPSINHVWMPGIWVWHGARYVWQPGYWVTVQSNWVWTPARYHWTPRGYIFVHGYWDYHLDRRGILFAPVYYQRPIYAYPSYFYAPIIALDIRPVILSLFILSHSHHFFFGDYYDVRYESRGYYPWYSRKATVYGYDFCYLGFRTFQHTRDPGWERYLHEQYRYRREHVVARPPHTFARQMELVRASQDAARQEMMARRIADMAAAREQAFRFQRMDEAVRRDMQVRGREVYRLQTERRQLEGAPGPDKRPPNPAALRSPEKVPLPRSPIVAPPPSPGRQQEPQPPSVRQQQPETGRPLPRQPEAQQPAQPPQVQPRQPVPQQPPQVRQQPPVTDRQPPQQPAQQPPQIRQQQPQTGRQMPQQTPRQPEVQQPQRSAPQQPPQVRQQPAQPQPSQAPAQRQQQPPKKGGPQPQETGKPQQPPPGWPPGRPQ